MGESKAAGTARTGDAAGVAGGAPQQPLQPLQPQGRRGPGWFTWLAAFPFALAWTFAAATLNAALAPAMRDEPGREVAPAAAPSPPPPPAHDLVFDSSELISV